MKRFKSQELKGVATEVEKEEQKKGEKRKQGKGDVTKVVVIGRKEGRCDRRGTQ